MLSVETLGWLDPTAWMHGMSNQTQGFTLVECMVCLAVACLLAAVAIPAYSRVQTKAQLTFLKSELTNAIAQSTRTSIATASYVVLCPGGNSCSEGSDWSQGWLAFVDTDGDRSRASSEPLLLHHGDLPKGFRIVTPAGRSSLLFNKKGATPGSNTIFTICHVSKRAQAQSLVIANSGRLRQQPATPDAAEACRTSTASR